jgi:glyoxylase-like metal-dependent hydrolase (beta-lactamase superfamily II)
VGITEIYGSDPLSIATILAPNPGPMTHEGTNTYAVGRDPCWVIDPGPDDAGHVKAIEEEGGRRGGIAAFLITHSHPDHSGAAELLESPLKLLVDGESEGPLTAMATPGHAADHVCLLAGEPGEEVCFCGDLLLGEGSSFVPPRAQGGSLADYLDSLRRLRARAPRVLYPGHGPPITDPVARIGEYVEHRLEREGKLVAALESGERSRERLLDIAWDDVPAELRPVAAIVMQAHLEKLEDEGRLPHDLHE